MTRTVSMSTAINEAMKISMRRDENVILIGGDVAGDAPKLINLNEVKLGVVFLVLRKDLNKSLAEIVYWIHQFLKRVIWELRWQLLQLGYVR